MEPSLHLDSQIMTFTIGEYTQVIDTLVDHYDSINNTADGIYGVSWTGDSACSHSEEFTHWAQSYQNIITALTQMKDTLHDTQQKMTLAVTDAQSTIAQAFDDTTNLDF